MSFPLISTTHTDIWIEFWNITFKNYLETEGVGSGSGSEWPFALSMSGRIKETEDDEFAPAMPGSPALVLIMPEGMKLVTSDKKYFELTEDVPLPLDANLTDAWVEPVATYDEGTEVWNWDSVIHETRPAEGTGVIAKLSTGSTEITELDVTEEETDVIILLPLIFQRIRALGVPSGGGEGGVSQAQFNLLNSKLDAALARIAALEKASGGTTSIGINSDLTETRLAVVMGSQARDRAFDLNVAPASLWNEATGSGQDTVEGPLNDVRAGGNW